MKTRMILKKAIPSIVMVLLLCFPKLSLEGARKGLLLWYQTVLPTLLPFMVCTNLILAMNGVAYLMAPIAPIFRLLFGLSQNGSFILFNGILCGYPMGAKTCSDFLDQGCISAAEAKSLYAVSSFPSPMFLAGYVMSKAGQAAGESFLLPFWKLAVSIYLPIFPIFFLASKIYGFSSATNQSGLNNNILPFSGQPGLAFDETLMSSIEVMVKIGGYLMIFSILSQFIQELFPAKTLTILLIAMTEMTTGIDLAASLSPGFSGILLILGAAAFGGFSGVFQVKSVTKNVGLSIRHYILWKFIHSLTACLLLAVMEYSPFL
jgi:hypothetical protein